VTQAEQLPKNLVRVAGEGIDGIANEDSLGPDVVYLQAKRYVKDNANHVGVECVHARFVD
jgi:restriction endonuclease Mrr